MERENGGPMRDRHITVVPKVVRFRSQSIFIDKIIVFSTFKDRLFSCNEHYQELTRYLCTRVYENISDTFLHSYSHILVGADEECLVGSICEEA